MAIKTRQTTATGVTNNDAPLTNDELDNNFVELVQGKADLSGATFTGDITTTGLTVQQSANGEVARFKTSTGGSGSIQGNVSIGFSHFSSTTHPAVLLEEQEISNASYQGDFHIKTRNVESDSAPETRVTVTAAGNVGIGVTPSAWKTSSDEKVLQIDTVSLYGNNANNSYLNNNWYLNSSSQSIYIESDFATSFASEDGKFVWYQTGSGTAGNTISWTSAMTLDASGNLLIGTTDTAVYDNSTASSASNGHNIRADGKADHARYTTTEGAAVLGLNRVGSNGYLTEFRKDGSQVGLIGTRNGYLHIRTEAGTNGSGIRFSDGYVMPCASDGSNSNATTDLGLSGSRFKDLYLSGQAKAESLSLYKDVTSGIASYIDFGEGSLQDIRLGLNVFDSEIPEAGTALVLDRTNTGSGDAHLVVHGNIYANHGGTPATANRVLTTADLSDADVAISERLLNSHGARLHNEPASGLRGTGMNMTDIGAVDTGANFANTGCRGLVWTGKHYIFIDSDDSRPTFHFYNSDLTAGKFKNGSATIDHNETDCFGPHGAAWDGRYIAVVGRNTSSGSVNNQLHIFDLDNLTSGYATRIAKVDLSSIVGATNNYGVGYAEGLYWLRNGTNLWGVEVDLASQTATTVVTKTGLANLTAQAITYDGSHLYMTQNGASMYKHSLDGALVASTATGNIPDCTAMTWNGQEFIGIEYDNGNIWTIPVTHESYSTHQVGELNVNEKIGTRDNSLSVSTPNNSCPAVFKANKTTAFAILPWSSSQTYLSSGVYYDDNQWVHASDNAYNSLFVFSGQAGAAWYASSNSTGSWNLATSAPLWNNLGQITATIRSASDGVLGDTYSYSSNAKLFINHGSNTVPATSGTTQNCPLRLRGGDNAMLDFGVNGGSGAWIQATNATSLNLNYPLDLNPNGGVVRIRSNDVAAESGTDLIIGDISSTDDAYVEFHADNGRWCQHIFYFDGVTTGTHDLWRVGAHYDTASSENFYRIYSRTRGKEMARFDAQNDAIDLAAQSMTLSGSSPILYLKNEDSATNSRATYILWRDSDNSQTAFVGFGSTSNDDFAIANDKASNLKLRNNGADRLTIDSGGDATFSGEVTVNSDERIKDNIEQIDGALEKVQAIRGVSFTRNDTEDDRRHVGVIAQEVEKVLPEVVKENKDTGIKSVAYANMVGLLIEAIKEQQTQIDDLKAEVTRLKGFE